MNPRGYATTSMQNVKSCTTQNYGEIPSDMNQNDISAINQLNDVTKLRDTSENVVRDVFP